MFALLLVTSSREFYDIYYNIYDSRHHHITYSDDVDKRRRTFDRTESMRAQSHHAPSEVLVNLRRKMMNKNPDREDTTLHATASLIVLKKETQDLHQNFAWSDYQKV